MGHKSTDGNKYLGDQIEFMPKEEPSLSHKAIRDWRNELREGNIRIVAWRKSLRYWLGFWYGWILKFNWWILEPSIGTWTSTNKDGYRVSILKWLSFEDHCVNLPPLAIGTQARIWMDTTTDGNSWESWMKSTGMNEIMRARMLVSREQEQLSV